MFFFVEKSSNQTEYASILKVGISKRNQLFIPNAT